MFKFVHIADSHLDSAIVSNDRYKDLILASMEKAFKASVNLCIEQKCDALLISGDLFDDEHLTFKTELMLRDSFDRLAKKDICVFYCLGNHDPKSSKIRRFKLGDNVHVFDEEIPQSIEVKDSENNVIGAVVGVGYTTKHMKENLAKRFRLPEMDVPIVGMLHTSLDIGGDNVYSPCTLDDLAVHNYDYWALGHIHKSEIYGQDKPVVFPGCPCGRHFAETGSKGAYLVSLDSEGVSTYEFVELADITWHDIKADGFDEVADASDMLRICADKITDIVDEAKVSFVRLTLEGPCSLYDSFNDEQREDLQESLSERTGASITLVSQLTSLKNPDDYVNDKHLLSIALEMAKTMKTDPDLKAQILEIVKEQYKSLDGGDSQEYTDSLLENIERRLCDVMIKQDE